MNGQRIGGAASATALSPGAGAGSGSSARKRRSVAGRLRAPRALRFGALLAVAGVGTCAVAGRMLSGRRLAEQHLAQERQETDRLLKVIDNTSAVIYMRDNEGRYLLVNRQYEQLFGIRRQDIVGLTDHDLFPKEMADNFRANDLRALSRGAPIQMEEVAPHPDGVHTYITVKYPIRDLAGRTYAICGISTDITPLKRVEEKERRLNAELEGRVRDRTAELEATARELDAFAYSVSHDLRAPLRAVAGFSEMLLEDHSGQLDEDGRDYLDRVVAATKHMGRLIDDLLNLSRAGRADLSRRPVDLSAMAHRVAGELAAADPEAAGSVRISIDDGLAAIGDPALLEIVMRNLVSNAWKFSAKQPEPAIHVGSTEQEGGTVLFVRDNGAGFDMRHADRLFAPFQRLHSATEFAGSGVGLALVARIITRHGGHVWAESEVGKGAAFYFTLPGAPDPPPAAGAEVP
ncbi:PAS domain S-box-containing protein [Catenulispora sp. GP43]|uniref:sensor histidine kinase n=1 Tax=Catenulispora sp. GP43 TaxID=3156263 RepID=UPI0035126140